MELFQRNLYKEQVRSGLLFSLSKNVTRTCISKTCSMVFASKRFPVLLNLVENIFTVLYYRQQRKQNWYDEKEIGKMKSKIGEIMSRKN